MLLGQAVENEEMVDKLRSILAQLEFSQIIRNYNDKGVPFTTHLHVPEIHPETGLTWYEREDPAHVLKVRHHCYIIYLYTKCFFTIIENCEVYTRGWTKRNYVGKIC